MAIMVSSNFTTVCAALMRSLVIHNKAVPAKMMSTLFSGPEILPICCNSVLMSAAVAVSCAMPLRKSQRVMVQYKVIINNAAMGKQSNIQSTN